MIYWVFNDSAGFLKSLTGLSQNLYQKMSPGLGFSYTFLKKFGGSVFAVKFK